MKNKNKTQTYQCKDCDKIFYNYRYHQRHVEGHINNNCTQCSEKFTKRKHLNNHMFHVHNIGEMATFECSFCQQKYVKRITLVTHIAKNHANGKHPCLECAEMFDTQEAHDEHMEDHNRQKPYACDRCGAKFHRKQQYLAHLNQHDKYECVTCNEKYAAKNRALEHKRLGHQVVGLEPRFNCEVCSKGFFSKGAVELHMQTHQNSGDGNNFSSSSIAVDQVQIKKSSKSVEEDFKINTYICEICKKIFDKRFKLSNHMKLTHSTDEYTCSLCSYRNNNKLNFMEHMKLHLAVERAFECDICNKSFYRKRTLQEHKNLVHNEILQFSCEICGMQFKRSSEIKRHLQTHSDERPHVCSECGQSYKRKTHLTRHLATTHKILTPQNPRFVQRLLKTVNGDLVPVNNNPVKNRAEEEKNHVMNEIISDLENTKSLITLQRVDDVAEDVLNLITSTQCVDLIEQYTTADPELWMVDNYSETPSSDLNPGPSFVDAEQYHTNSQFDHIDTKDLIVLSSEQMMSVDAVVESSQKEDILLPDYLQTFYL